MIEVPVYVFGPDGQPIRGLTKEAFELRVNGRPQPIEYFDAIDFSAPTSPETRRPPRERRLYLLLFDQHYSAPGRIARAQAAAVYAVEQSNPQTDLFAVATYRANKGVQLATPFLSDRVAVRRAIDTLAVSQARDPLGLAISSGERSTWMEIAERGQTGFSPGSRDDLADAEIADTLRGGAANQDMQTQSDRYMVEDLLGNFGDLAARLSALEGQKHILYFSEGFQSSLIHGGLSPVPANPLSGGGLDARSFRILGEMFRYFRAAGVFLDSIDIEGVRHSQAKFDSFANDSLQFIAHGTGGEFVHKRNDLGNAVNDLPRAQRVVYILAFDRHSNRDGNIDVRVKGVPRGTRVSYRQGFGNAARSKDVDPLQLADILINDVPQSGLTLQVTASRSDIALELRRKEIVPQLIEKTPTVDTILYVFDDRGNAVLAKQRSLRFDAAERQAAEPVVLREPLDLPPGRYVAKALARIAGTNSLGYARTDFIVPASP